ncbi:MAG: hypothetical protein CSA66_01130 [Proteobacteria bacterium]|nr:MAG: hypothetical protein CSA66_01130 [Pseudomonadota bacterium]
MDFTFDTMISGPVDRVMELLRDRLVELVPYLPAIDHVEEREREVDGARVRIVNAWQGNSKGLPLFAKPFVTKAMTAWSDVAIWDAGARSVQWRFIPRKFQGLYTCGGTNYLVAEGDQTRLTINGNLEIHPEKLPMPRRMADRFAPRVAKWAVGKVGPNLLQVPAAVQAFFEAERGAVDGPEPGTPAGR